MLYLAGVIPSIWLLELKNFKTRGEIHFCSDMYWGGEVGIFQMMQFNAFKILRCGVYETYNQGWEAMVDQVFFCTPFYYAFTFYTFS